MSLFETFTINWPYFLAAIALLWMPRQWLRTGKRVLKRRRKPDGALEELAGMGARNPEDRSVHPAKEFKNFRNYVDMLRGVVGGYCLVEFGVFATKPEGSFPVYAIIAAILFVGVLIQSLRFDARISFFAAVFYMAGLSVGSTEHYSSLFAFALVLAVNPIIANPRMFMVAYGVFLLVFGTVFADSQVILCINVFLFLLIPVLSLLTKRPVVIFSRKSKSSSG
ncbi:hypothetical protein [Oleiharenicola lentus]|uniref:hypothetical protein n=1 Tax=Oleiharenicola lentus TaxID=2508720 RepID=UPI003F676AE3